MTHEVVVVGGGIGGLTVAALLAARGVDVCLLERQPQVGGCVAAFEKFGYTFEPTAGLYPCWARGDLHQRVFAELPVAPPETRALPAPYIAHLSDGSEVRWEPSGSRLNETLASSFPECATAAIEFYRELLSVGGVLSHALARVPDFPTTNRVRQTYALFPRVDRISRLEALRGRRLIEELQNTSARFREFVELQLRVFSATPLANCGYLAACALLSAAQQNLFTIRGGAGALAEKLHESIKLSGGQVRLNTPVLRLAYNSASEAVGVDLLSGETIQASKAIVSNMTLWDTYGKLIGLQGTPAELKKRLGEMESRGAYLIYSGLDEDVAHVLKNDRLLIASADPPDERLIDPSKFLFAAAPEWDRRAPSGKRAVTITFASDVEQWFTYQADAEEQDTKDQLALEQAWEVLHRNLPALGNGIEVIDTVNPLAYYESTRRKLGMVWGTGLGQFVGSELVLTHRTVLPNVFIVGDTAFPGAGIAAATQSALIVANEIVPN